VGEIVGLLGDIGAKLNESNRNMFDERLIKEMMNHLK